MIEVLRPPFHDNDIRQLARLLVDAVESGAAVTMLAPLSATQAELWWRKAIATFPPSASLLVARNRSSNASDEIIGTVQLVPPSAMNQQHRAEVAKLLVDRQHRRTGIGTRLMQSIEQVARDSGFRLLTLDTKRGDPAERLYERLGWVRLGTIHGYALDPDGRSFHDAVFFFKQLE